MLFELTVAIYASLPIIFLIILIFHADGPRKTEELAFLWYISTYEISSAYEPHVI